MEENAGFGAAEIIKLYDRWRKTFRAFNRDFAVFFFFFFSLETEYFVSTSASTTWRRIIQILNEYRVVLNILFVIDIAFKIYKRFTELFSYLFSS